MFNAFHFQMKEGFFKRAGMINLSFIRVSAVLGRQNFIQRSIKPKSGSSNLQNGKRHGTVTGIYHRISFYSAILLNRTDSFGSSLHLIFFRMCSK